ncbi:zinc knuckle CX2CX4HX4C containing protein [Tanacetum coccineum]
MRPAQALTAIQSMADHSQKWHDETTRRNIESSSSKDGLAALVGCQICEGPYLDKDCPLNEEVKQVEEVRYGEFGRTKPFNGNNGGKFQESTRRSTEMEVWIKKLQENAEINTRNPNASLKNLETQIKQLTEELHYKKEKSEHAKEENTNDQLPTKESNPGNFTLPYTIGNFTFYAMADLGASVNVLPRNIFKYLELTNLSETEMLVEMADMRKKAQLSRSNP